jgi:ParB family chromosome partitioning protein
VINIKKIKYPIKEIDLKHIRSNQILSLSVKDKDKEFCEKNIREYGLLTPLVVLEKNDGGKITVSGETEIAVLRDMGVIRTDVMIPILKDPEDVGKITFLMSEMNKCLNPITEGLILKEMINTCGITQGNLGSKLRKSQPWISKRLSLVDNLKESVIQMVFSKMICPRSAEEIAKLPQEKQHSFALALSKSRLPKTAVEKLVSTYRRNSTCETLRNEIIANPKLALLKISSDLEMKKIRIQISDNQKIDSALRFLLNVSSELGKYISDINTSTFEKYNKLLVAASIELGNLRLLIANCFSRNGGNSPGNFHVEGGDNLK